MDPYLGLCPQYFPLPVYIGGVEQNITTPIFNRADRDVHQQVDVGDASDQLGTNQLHVIADGDALSQVLGDIEIRPRAITPNGDRRNDRIRITYGLYGVLTATVEIGFYTLHGVRVHRIASADVEAGVHSVEWDGSGAEGELLAPGLYLCRLAVETERGRFQRVQSVAVAY